MAETDGKFVWYDLMTGDQEAAERFYASVIGWEIKDAGMPNGRYALLSAGPAMVGGMMGSPERLRATGAPPMWMGHIGVSDVDAYAARVKAVGGEIRRQPEDVPGVGRFAVAADPQGAVFVLLHGNSPPRPRLRAHLAMSAGMSSTRTTPKAPSRFTPRCLAGQRRRPSTWARGVFTRPSRRAAPRSAA